jgi:hypothetical protein
MTYLINGELFAALVFPLTKGRAVSRIYKNPMRADTMRFLIACTCTTRGLYADWGLMWTLGPDRANGLINYKHIDSFTQRFPMLALTINDLESTQKIRPVFQTLGLSMFDSVVVPVDRSRFQRWLFQD